MNKFIKPIKEIIIIFTYAILIVYVFSSISTSTLPEWSRLLTSYASSIVMLTTFLTFILVVIISVFNYSRLDTNNIKLSDQNLFYLPVSDEFKKKLYILIGGISYIILSYSILSNIIHSDGPEAIYEHPTLIIAFIIGIIGYIMSVLYFSFSKITPKKNYNLILYTVYSRLLFFIIIHGIISIYYNLGLYNDVYFSITYGIFLLSTFIYLISYFFRVIKQNTILNKQEGMKMEVIRSGVIEFSIPFIILFLSFIVPFIF